MIIKNFIEGPYDCHQCVMANLAAYYGHVYQVAALGKIAFMFFNGEVQSIGQSIDALHLRSDSKRFELLGLERQRYPMGENCQQRLDDYLNRNIPIVIWSDLYDCKWNQAYHKYHFEHCFFLNGKADNGDYVISDPYFGVKEYNVSLYDLDDVAKEYRCYKKIDIQGDIYSETEKEIIKDAKYYMENQMGENIVMFSKKLREADFLREFNHHSNDLYAIPLLDNLKIVGEQRAAYAELLKYLGENYQVKMASVSKWLSTSAELWGKIRMYFMKMVIMGTIKCDCTLVESYLQEIRQLEEETFRIILEW